MIAHWFAWGTVIIGITELSTYVARKHNWKGLKHFRGKHHMVWGKIMIGIGFLHGILAGGSGFLTINAGTISWILIILLWGIHYFRKRLGKNWLKWHRVIALIMIPVVGIHVLIKIV